MSRVTTGPSMSTSSWRTLLAAVCIAQGTAIVGFDFTVPFIPLYLQHDLSVHGQARVAIWSGVILFAPAIFATVCGPLWGRLADRWGYRFMLLRAMTSAAILLALMGLAPSAWLLVLLRVIQGALTGTVFSAQALVAAAVPERETGRSMGLLQMSVFMGGTLGPIGGGAVADLIGYRATYICAGLLIAAATLVVLLFVWEPAHHRERRESAESPPSMWSVIAIPAFLAALSLTLVAQLAVTLLFPVIPLFVQELLHSTRNVASFTGWLLAASGLAAGAGSYVGGRLQRRLGVRPLLVATIALSSLLLLPQAYVHSFLALLILRCAGGFALGALLGLVGTLAATSSPADAKGTAFGLMGAASSLGFGLGPLMGGALTAALGIRPVFIVAAAILGLVPLLLVAVTAARARLARWVAAPIRLVSQNDS